jgi:hypothetical protein
MQAIKNNVGRRQSDRNWFKTRSDWNKDDKKKIDAEDKKYKK